MTKLTKMFLTIGGLLLLIAVVIRIAGIPIIVSMREIKPASLLILANTSLLLALLFKK